MSRTTHGTIAAVGRALPEHRHEQGVLTRSLLAMLDVTPAQRKRLETLHERVGVRHRHLALPIEEYPKLDTFGKANDAWIRCAVDLGERAIGDALARAGLRPEDVDALFVVSVTGVANPSVDARLVNRMGLRADVKRTPIFGLGCVAGVAGISRAVDFVRAYPDGVAVLLSVELCSLNVQARDLSVASMISSGLFGDGAAAVAVVGAERAPSLERLGPGVCATRASFYPDTEDVMGWQISEDGFRIVLSEGVPTIARDFLGRDVRAFLDDLELEQSDIASWVCHPGGPKVLEAMQAALELSDEDVALSWELLARQGNLSSASVLMVLREVFDRARPARRRARPPARDGARVLLGDGAGRVVGGRRSRRRPLALPRR